MGEMTRLWIEQRRGFAIEAEHAVDAVLVDAHGSVRVLAGSDALTTFRSAAKPFQLEVAHGLLDPEVRLTLTPRDLALGTASHHGEPSHVEGVAQLLTKLGCTEADLHCGAHLPTHTESAHALLARGEPMSALHNNCAGKHAFMAAASRTHGFAHDYRPADHPLQRAILARLAEHTEGAVIGTVTDGCGIPCFVLPLSAMARAYAALARAYQHGRAPLATIGHAMRAHPRLVSGSEAFDGWLMEHTTLLAKVGALGLLCVADPERELGLAIKVRSGSELARAVAVEAVLARHLPGVLSEPLPARHRVVHNVAGDEVGSIVRRFEED